MITVVVLLSCLAASVLSVLTFPVATWRMALALAAVTAVAVIQCAHSLPGRLRRLPRPGTRLLCCQAVLALIPAFVCPGTWTAAPGFLAGSLLLYLPQKRAWWAFGVLMFATGVVTFVLADDFDDVPYALVASTSTGLVLYALMRITELLAEMHQSRLELARQAIVREQHRFARDLHDLLGYSLATIGVKSSLAARLLPDDVEQARTELAEILIITRQAATDMREVVHRYRGMSLVAEVAAAESLLASIGVRADTRIEVDGLDATIETVLATVLREGLANMMRHSSATECVITAERDGDYVRFGVCNDRAGAAGSRGAGPGRLGGTGLASLAVRVEGIGGRLQVGIDGGGWFRLIALVPDPAAVSDPATRPDPAAVRDATAVPDPVAVPGPTTPPDPTTPPEPAAAPDPTGEPCDAAREPVAG
ncbi:histidine kinase [Embleya sp. NPDC005971]|uniref:sensor histidine kinase n=1 Tax=Embleya sp. NPDC005971 TaxID=3156724 RepID=UPI0034102C0D